MTKTRFDLAAWKAFIRLGSDSWRPDEVQARLHLPACRRLNRGATLLQLHHLFRSGSGIWPDKLKTRWKEVISLHRYERHFDVTVFSSFFFFFGKVNSLKRNKRVLGELRACLEKVFYV